MCDEDRTSPYPGGAALGEQYYNRAEGQSLNPLKGGPSLRRSLELRLQQSQKEVERLSEAINLLGPEEEKTVELLRKLNRLGALQL